MIITVLAIVVGALSLGVAIYALLQTRTLNQRFTAALGGEDAGSLESTLAGHIARVEAVDHRLTTLNAEYKRLAITNGLASQKISIVRFNPFGDTGGDQSFSLAVLDAHDSGYVLSSIHGRQGTRVYVKPVDFAKSKYTLSAEERQALDQAIKRVPQTNPSDSEIEIK
ncbi:MAG: hypothetical protein JWN01_918 [Patescibacteria group bacterium]|nr:hypothetical protein [Patescibacteria group bacterium]